MEEFNINQKSIKKSDRKGGGIIIIFKDKYDQISTLLIKNQKNIWFECGGNFDMNSDSDMFDTAARESKEESSNLFNISSQQLRKLSAENKEFNSFQIRNYLVCVLHIQYEDKSTEEIEALLKETFEKNKTQIMENANLIEKQLSQSWKGKQDLKLLQIDSHILAQIKSYKGKQEEDNDNFKIILQNKEEIILRDRTMLCLLYLYENNSLQDQSTITWNKIMIQSCQEEKDEFFFLKKTVSFSLQE